MRLTPGERDRLLLFATAELARARRSRGLRLNVPEATALIADEAAEAARDGLRLVDAIERGRRVLSVDDVLEGVADILTEVRVEATFDDGTRLIVVSDPFRRVQVSGSESGGFPGAIVEAGHDVGHRVIATIDVVNESDVPITVTSHFHFFEVNPQLRFDRAAAYGRHLAIDAGSAVRFAPGERVSVALSDIAGARVIVGFAGFVDGPLDAPGAREEALRRARACGYRDGVL